MHYSPKPIEDYIEVSEHLGSIRGIAEQGMCSCEMWNLYWLSEPQLDGLLDKEKPWWESYQVNEALLVAVTRDVLEDYHLAQALSWSPSRFLDWFCREDPTIYDCYEVFGPGWVETVKRRAMEAAERLGEREAYVPLPSNVVQVNFGKRRD